MGVGMKFKIKIYTKNGTIFLKHFISTICDNPMVALSNRKDSKMLKCDPRTNTWIRRRFKVEKGKHFKIFFSRTMLQFLRLPGKQFQKVLILNC